MGNPGRVDEGDVAREAHQALGGALTAPCQQQDRAGKEGQQDRAADGRHAVESIHPRERDGDEESQPEDGVEHHRRADPLGGQAESCGAVVDAAVGEQAVAEGGTWSRTPRDDVGDGEGRHIDAKEPPPSRGVRGEHGVGELGVADKGGHFGHEGQHQEPDGHLAEQVDGLAGRRDLREQEVLGDEGEDEDSYRPANLPAQREAPPAGGPFAGGGGFGPWSGGHGGADELGVGRDGMSLGAGQPRLACRGLARVLGPHGSHDRTGEEEVGQGGVGPGAGVARSSPKIRPCGRW